MSTEVLTDEDRALLARCYRCTCAACASRRDLLQKMVRIIDSFAGPRCAICRNLCVDIAKDDDGRCPDCSAIEAAP